MCERGSEPSGFEDSGSGDDGLMAALWGAAGRGEARGGAQRAGLKLPRLRALGGAPPSGEEEGEPDLGEDSFDVRLRARARAVEAGEGALGPPPGAPGVASKPGGRESEKAPCYDELRRRYQVDLNSEENLGDLEDPGLAEHMRRRREEREALEAARASLPRKEELKRGDAEGRRALSSLTARLKDQQMALQVAGDEVHAHASNVGKYSDGAQPHGYPPVSGPQGPVLRHLQAKLMEAVKALGDITVALDEFERDLTLARRGYEFVVDGLNQWCEFHERAAAPETEPRSPA